jgi:DNA-binding Xre family transcriptional regulator
MRLRVPQLLRDRGITAYILATRSAGRISMSTAYYFARTGTFRCLKPDQLEALCDVLKVEPGELFERGRKKKG